MTIKIKVNAGVDIPEIYKNGDWIDLCTAEDVNLVGPIVGKDKKVMFQSKLIDLGVAMKLPSGFEAHVLPRSSTFKKFGMLLVNSQGIIDETYCGNEDIWKFGVVAFKNVSVPAGTRIAQFRIQLSQKATFWQKLRWILSNSVKIKVVKNLSDNNRGGIGSTGF